MKKLVNEFLTMSLTTSLVLIIVGTILLILPGLSLSVMCYAISAILIINGIMISYNSYQVSSQIKLFDGFTWGVLCIIIGAFLTFNHNIFISIVPIILGLWIIINSCFKLRICMVMDKDSDFAPALIMSLVTLVCGLFLLFNPINSAELLTRMIGLIIMIYATIDLVETTTFKRNIKKIEKIFKD